MDIAMTTHPVVPLELMTEEMDIVITIDNR